MTRVLILTASSGSGHTVAARSLAAGFECERAAVTVVDHFRELVHPLFDRWSRALYHTLLRRAPFLWGLGYSLGDWMASDSSLTLGATRLGTRRLAALLERLTPDVVVTVHATPAAAMSALARLGDRVPPHTTVITDFVAHSQWIARHVDRYCVADTEVRHELIARGIPVDRILVTGVPVRAEFAALGAPAAARQALGLSARTPVVLAMAGSQGALGRLPDVARALRAMRRPLQGLIVAGPRPPLAPAPPRLAVGPPTPPLRHRDEHGRLARAAGPL